MALRLIEVIIPSDSARDVHRLLEELDIRECWGEQLDSQRHRIKILVNADRSEEVLDGLEERFRRLEDFRLIVLPVEAAIPRPDESEGKDEPAKEERRFGFSRLSREELYSDVQDTSRLTAVYLTMVALSAVVASIGLLQGSIVAIIGAMVIAPLLGPNVALALATTLGDLKLVRRSLASGLAGGLVVLAVAYPVGLVVGAGKLATESLVPTEVGLGDLVLAFAAGAAGALAFTSGIPATLVGVMVAVALLPPLVAAGILAGAGSWQPAWGSFLLFLSNLICINLAGVLTFLVQGIRPIAWWEADRARRATITAIILWVLLLAILVLLIMLARQR